MQVYALKVEDKPMQGYLMELEDDLKVLQEYVGGLIEVLSISENIDAVFNEEGLLQQLPPNRAVVDDDMNLITILVGNIFCCRHNDEGEFTSIQPEDIEIINKYLKKIELISELGVLVSAE